LRKIAGLLMAGSNVNHLTRSALAVAGPVMQSDPARATEQLSLEQQPTQP
jgi:hypothetical protein